MVDRKYIYLCKTGSHLYGTNTETSDEDLMGVYLPSTQDLLSLRKDPDEIDLGTKLSTGARNELGDLDKKYYTLKKFLKHAADGQPWALEMLFVPSHCVVETSPEWNRIQTVAMPFMLSKKGVAGFLGMAASQAHKSSIKGDNLNKIRSLIVTIEADPSNRPISALISEDIIEDSVEIHGVEVNIATAKDGTKCLEIAGRMFNLGLSQHTFLKSLINMYETYGTRSHAAARSGTDPKSLYHAYRLVSEAREFLTTGHITLPRPDREFLLELRAGKHKDMDHNTNLLSQISEIQDVVVPSSFLPDEPDWDAINDVCVAILWDHLNAK